MDGQKNGRTDGRTDEFDLIRLDWIELDGLKWTGLNGWIRLYGIGIGL